MDSFEFSKIAGAVLSALLLIVGTKVLIDSNRHGGPATAGYNLPIAAEVAAPAAEGGAPPKDAGAATFDAAAVVAQVAAGKADNGEAVFKRCAACHVADKAAKSTVAPNLWGIVGRKPASREDFAKYSDAMKAKGGAWGYAELAGFVHNPAAYLSGTAMKFPGIKDGAEVADLLAYLRTLADTPAALP